MAGEKDLSKLLSDTKPVLNNGEYIFCSLTDSDQVDWKKAICSFREKEGFTAILLKEVADESAIGYDNVYSWITLTIHSSLDAVGLTAAFSTSLAKAGISCNVVAAFYHDHIFVPANDASRAMEVLQQLSIGQDHTA